MDRKRFTQQHILLISLFLVLALIIGTGENGITGSAVETDDYDLEEVDDDYFEDEEYEEDFEDEVYAEDEYGEEDYEDYEEEPYEEEVYDDEFADEEIYEEYEEPLPPKPTKTTKNIDTSPRAPPTGIPGNLVREKKPDTSEISNVQILNQQVWWGKALRPKEQVDDETWFQDIRCERYTGEPQGVYGKGTKKQDKLSFKIINNDERQYRIGYTLPYTEFLKNKMRSKRLVPMRIALNARRIRDIKTCCGTDIIEPGQVLECNDCAVLLRWKESNRYMETHTTMVNNLELDTDYVSSQVTFICNEE